MGNLRFRAPQPNAGWQGVRQATAHGAVCPQFEGAAIIGDEDCLFLNIYTQDLIGSRPVMVFVHGGSYFDGSGNSDDYGPTFFVQDGVLLITINYRLNVLGFLSTGDRHAQGNFGLKDMVQALRWIQANIAAFGGDPDNVTIFGESAGASAVHFLVLSSMANGLFHKAIAESGSVISPWAFEPNAVDVAIAFGQRLGLQTTSFENLVASLRTVPILLLLINIPLPQQPQGFRPFDFGPCVEGPDFTEPRFLIANPLQMMMNGDFNNVPFMMGFNDAEALFQINIDLPPNTDDTFVPILWNVPDNSPAAAEIANTFRNFYFNGAPISDATRFNYVEVSISKFNFLDEQ